MQPVVDSSAPAGRARALLGSCHPLPALAVTAFGTALGVAAGASAGTASLLAAALLAGQLSIGWLNDVLDADLDATAGRTDKPVARGDVSRRAVLTAAVAAAAVSVPLSLLLGAVAGSLHLLVVLSGWVYDLRLKFTVLSPLPYLTAFGALPAAASTAAGAPVDPALVVAAGTLGVAAHFANTVPDADADARTGVRGLPQLLGPRASQVVAASGVALACCAMLASLLLGAGTPVDGAVGIGAVALLVSSAVLGGLSPLTPARWAFRLLLAAAALAVTGVLLGGLATL